MPCAPPAGCLWYNCVLTAFATDDARLLFCTRFTRLFAYGALSVVLVFYLTGLSTWYFLGVGFLVLTFLAFPARPTA